MSDNANNNNLTAYEYDDDSDAQSLQTLGGTPDDEVLGGGGNIGLADEPEEWGNDGMDDEEEPGEEQGDTELGEEWEEVPVDLGADININFNDVDRNLITKLKESAALLKNKVREERRKSMDETDFNLETEVVYLHVFAEKRFWDHLMKVIKTKTEDATKRELELITHLIFSLSFCNVSPTKAFLHMEAYPLVRDIVSEFKEATEKKKCERAMKILRSLDPERGDARK